MSEERRTIEELISNWKYACGLEKVSDRGTSYIVVPIPNRRNHFLDLIETMVNEGLTKEEIKSPSVSTNVVLTCWSDLIVKMSSKDLKKARDITRSQWEEAIKEFFAQPISKYRGPDKTSNISSDSNKEKELDLEPKDRIKLDTSDMPEIPWADDILSELAALGSFVDKKNE